MRPHRGSTILVYGILGLVLCQLLGIAAWKMANDDLRQMEFGQMDPSGRDLTTAGRILGMIATAVLVFQLIIMMIVLAAVVLSPR